MNVAIALGIVVGLYFYVAVGRAYFARIDASFATHHPEMAESCEFRTSLAAGHVGARFTRWAFLLSWPLWLLAGFVLACRPKIG